jgi:hypothetical protein
MTGYTDSQQTEGADVMTGTVVHQRFGQEINPHRLSPLARRMAATIGDGTPAAWAGFAWYQPKTQQPVLHPRRDDPRSPVAGPARAA